MRSTPVNLPLTRNANWKVWQDREFINILLEELENLVYDIYYVFHLTSFLKDLKFDRRNDRI